MISASRDVSSKVESQLMINEMKFGVFDHLDRGPWQPDELYRQRLALIEHIERCGFHCYHLAEHHSTPIGMAPSPNVFLAALAQKTSTLRFGPLVYLLPLYHPLRLSEEIAMLDQMSNGRLDVGVGRGRSPIELDLYGQSPDTSKEVFDEVLRILKEAFSKSHVNFKGNYYSFDGVPVEIHPRQIPHPPLWYGVGTKESATEIASNGIHGVTLARPGPAAEIAEAYFEAASRSGFQDQRLGVCRFVVCSDTDAHAKKIADRAYPIWHRSFFELFKRFNRKPMQSWPDNFSEMESLGLAFAGSPTTLRDKIAEQLRATVINYFVGQFFFGDVSYAEGKHSSELFAAEVIPALSFDFKERSSALPLVQVKRTSQSALN